MRVQISPSAPSLCLNLKVKSQKSKAQVKSQKFSFLNFKFYAVILRFSFFKIIMQQNLKIIPLGGLGEVGRATKQKIKHNN